VEYQALPFAEPATGLVYARARWYDPSTGSFLSPDPMGYQDSSNLYAFAAGDPVNGRDPRGEENAADASRAAQAKVPQHVVAVWENTRLPNDNVAALQLLFQIWLGEQAKGFLSNFQFGEGFADAIASFRGGRYVNALNDLVTDAGRGLSLFALFRSLGPRGGIRPPTPPRTAPAPAILVTPEGVMVPAGTGGAIPMANPPTGLIGPPVILASSLRGGFGEGPEARGVNETGARGAGVTRKPRHHVFPQEFRDWFRARGFIGKRDIDNFTLELDQSTHEAIHGGGNFRLGKEWEGEWNRQLMARLVQREKLLRRNLTFDEVFETGQEMMKDYGLEGPFIPFR
jgi:RHS repeat-associated protein